MRVYSHSYWLGIICTTNRRQVLARERWQTLENSWKKTQYLMNTPFPHSLTDSLTYSLTHSLWMSCLHDPFDVHVDFLSNHIAAIRCFYSYQKRVDYNQMATISCWRDYWNVLYQRIYIYVDAGYSPFHIRLFQTKFHLVKRGFPSAFAKKGLEISH